MNTVKFIRVCYQPTYKFTAVQVAILFSHEQTNPLSPSQNIEGSHGHRTSLAL